MGRTDLWATKWMASGCKRTWDNRTRSVVVFGMLITRTARCWRPTVSLFLGSTIQLGGILGWWNSIFTLYLPCLLELFPTHSSRFPPHTHTEPHNSGPSSIIYCNRSFVAIISASCFGSNPLISYGPCWRPSSWFIVAKCCILSGCMAAYRSLIFLVNIL